MIKNHYHMNGVLVNQNGIVFLIIIKVRILSSTARRTVFVLPSFVLQLAALVLISGSHRIKNISDNTWRILIIFQEYKLLITATNRLFVVTYITISLTNIIAHEWINYIIKLSKISNTNDFFLRAKVFWLQPWYPSWYCWSLYSRIDILHCLWEFLWRRFELYLSQNINQSNW